jgi:fructose-specific phosphotransferase system IIC component
MDLLAVMARVLCAFIAYSRAKKKGLNTGNVDF